MIFLKIFLICCLVSSLGLIKFLFFISYGYGLSISSVGFYLLISQQELIKEEIFLGILYIIYGLRLSLFLFIRNRKESFKVKMKDRIETKKDYKLSFVISIWLSCALLYACQSSPLGFISISTNKENKKSLHIGIIISLLGLILEILSDNQKSAAKKINPKRFVDTGFYKYVRCPNYFGEIIFWSGNFIAGINMYVGFFQWFITLLGYVGILYVMFSGARRIEIHQNKSYGNDDDYKRYVKNTPIIIPFLPLYSVEKYTWLKA